MQPEAPALFGCQAQLAQHCPVGQSHADDGEFHEKGKPETTDEIHLAHCLQRVPNLYCEVYPFPSVRRGPI